MDLPGRFEGINFGLLVLAHRYVYFRSHKIERAIWIDLD
jgi:hypothetical protein